MAATPPHYQHVPHSPPPHPRTSTNTANHDSLTAATATTPATPPSSNPTDSSTTTTFTTIPVGGDASPMALSPPFRPSSQSELAQYRSRTLIAVLALIPTLSLLIAAWFYAIVCAPTVLLQARNVALLQVANVVMVTLERVCACIFPKELQSHPLSHSSPSPSPLDKPQSPLLPTRDTDGAHMNTSSVVGASARTTDTAGVTSSSLPPSGAFTMDDGLDDDDTLPSTRRTASVIGLDVDSGLNDTGRACAEKTLPLFVSRSLPASHLATGWNSPSQALTTQTPVELRSLLIN